MIDQKIYATHIAFQGDNSVVVESEGDDGETVTTRIDADAVNTKTLSQFATRLQQIITSRIATLQRAAKQ